ncbi:MAG: cyclophilin-like fold protein [Candidatus Bathyarchaeia archaeon]
MGMMHAVIPLKIELEGVGIARGELKRFLSPLTVGKIVDSLPLSGRIARWKEEVYFEVPVKMGPEKPRGRVETGALAYWPMGSAICIFYGESQPYSPVNLIGKVTDNIGIFREAAEGTLIVLDRIL